MKIGRTLATPAARILFATAMAAGSVWAGSASAQPPFPEAMRFVQSEPITVNDATFAAVVQAEWQRPINAMEFNRQVVTQVDLQFFLTNHKKATVAFPTQGTFGVKLFSKDGKEIVARLEKKGMLATGPVVLPEGGSYAMNQCADLSPNGNSAEFSFFDGGGVLSIIGPLEPGTYKLVYSYSVSAEQAAKVKVQGGRDLVWKGRDEGGDGEAFAGCHPGISSQLFRRGVPSAWDGADVAGRFEASPEKRCSIYRGRPA